MKIETEQVTFHTITMTDEQWGEVAAVLSNDRYFNRLLNWKHADAFLDLLAKRNDK